MAMASTEKVVLGSIAFVVFWVMAVFPSVPFLPIGRTAGALLGAMLMVIFRVITPDQAYAAIDLPILGLLFGTMVVSVYLDRADMFKYLGKLLSYKSRGPKDLLCRICLVSGVSSALFTNDTSCIVLTEFVLKLADQHNLPPRPLLLALASSANIGSSATPIGNPQNLVIAIQSKISFGSFLIGLLPAMVVGIIINVLILLVMYWRELSVPEGLTEDRATRDDQATQEEDRDPSSVLSEEQDEGTDEGTAMAEYVEEGRGNEAGLNNSFSVECPDEKETRVDRWKRMLWKCCVYVITVGMLVALLLGLNMSWTAITAALALIVLDFTDAGSSLNKVSYSLLIFFCGMFITVEGFNRTGIPTALWDLMEPHSKINHPSGIAVLAIVILLLSNLASNVPTVLLMGARVAASAAAISTADEKKSWLILAWVSTVAGNLSLLGSAANLIVCEQARRAPNLGYNLSFWGHLKFGVPSTLIVTAIGLMLIK